MMDGAVLAEIAGVGVTLVVAVVGGFAALISYVKRQDDSRIAKIEVRIDSLSTALAVLATTITAHVEVDKAEFAALRTDDQEHRDAMRSLSGRVDDGFEGVRTMIHATGSQLASRIDNLGLRTRPTPHTGFPVPK